MPLSLPAACTLFVLGQPRLCRPGGPAHVLERRDAALLASLVLAGPLPRERAATWLWPRADPKARQNNLRQRLFRLKQLAGFDLVGSAAVLRLGDAVEHDIGNYGARLAAGALDEGGAADDSLLATLDYSDLGELADSVQALRDRWHRQRQALLAQAAVVHEQHGRLDAALHGLDRLLVHEPAAEGAHRDRMRLLYLRGDRIAALAAWNRCVQALKNEADAQPDARTRAMAALIERSGVLPDALAPGPPELPAALLRPPLLVGRAEAWGTLKAALDSGQVVLIEGEPGVGKSRLLGDFVQHCGGAVLHGARPGDAGLPYSLLQRVLRGCLAFSATAPAPWVRAEFARLLPDCGEAAPGRLQPLRLQRAVAQALADAFASGLRLLAIDDFQFADAATQELLLACAAEDAPGLPLLWLAVRAAEKPATLVEWAAGQPVGHVVAVRLAPLDTRQVGEFVASLGAAVAAAPRSAETAESADWVPMLVQRTGGNPLFMLQVLQAWHAAPGSALLPASVGALIEARLDRLGAPALRLARVAALAGPDFTLGLCAEVLEVHAVDLADGLAELQRAQLMVDTAFAYDLVAEAALRTVPAALAALLHGAIAGALARRGGAPARVARHWSGARQWAVAARQYELAAAQAKGAARLADEVAWEDEAVRCYQQAGATEAAFAARVRAARTAITAEQAAAAAQRSDALLSEATQPGQRLDALLVQAEQRLTGGRLAGAEPAQAALALARGLNDRQRELSAVNLLGASLVLAGRGVEALALFETQLPLPEPVDIATEQAFCSHYAYVLAGASRYRDALAPIRRACELAERMGALDGAMNEEGNLATMLHRLGDVPAALAAAERAVDFWRRLGEPASVPGGAVQMRAGVFYLTAGRYTQALAAFNLAMPMFRAGQAHEWALHTEHHLARAWLALGQAARARQVLSPLADDASTIACNKRLMVEARIARQLDAPYAERLSQGLRFGTEVYGSDRYDAQLMLASVLPPAEALRLCDEVAAASQGQQLSAARHAWLRKGLCLARLGRADEALRSVRQALESGDDGALELTAPEFCGLAFQALEMAGADAAAQAVLQRGVAWLATAQQHVPFEFVDSYRHRNADHRALLLRAATLQAAGGETAPRAPP